MIRRRSDRRPSPEPRPVPDPAAVQAVERARGAVVRNRILDARSQEIAAARQERTAANGFVDMILEAFAR